MTLSGTVDQVTTTWTPAPDLLADSPTTLNLWLRSIRMAPRISASATTQRQDAGDWTVLPRPTASATDSGQRGSRQSNELCRRRACRLSNQFCTNPLPASGGIDPETNAQICRRAPQAFLTQERAVTMQDYVNVTEQNPQ